MFKAAIWDYSTIHYSVQVNIPSFPSVLIILNGKLILFLVAQLNHSKLVQVSLHE